MNDDQKINYRAMCLSMAVTSCGDDTCYEYVLEAAEAYAAFMFGKKPNLRVVANDGEST